MIQLLELLLGLGALFYLLSRYLGKWVPKPPPIIPKPAKKRKSVSFSDAILKYELNEEDEDEYLNNIERNRNEPCSYEYDNEAYDDNDELDIQVCQDQTTNRDMTKDHKNDLAKLDTCAYEVYQPRVQISIDQTPLEINEENINNTSESDVFVRVIANEHVDLPENFPEHEKNQIELSKIQTNKYRDKTDEQIVQSDIAPKIKQPAFENNININEPSEKLITSEKNSMDSSKVMNVLYANVIDEIKNRAKQDKNENLEQVDSEEDLIDKFPNVISEIDTEFLDRINKTLDNVEQQIEDDILLTDENISDEV